MDEDIRRMALPLLYIIEALDRASCYWIYVLISAFRKQVISTILIILRVLLIAKMHAHGDPLRDATTYSTLALYVVLRPIICLKNLGIYVPRDLRISR
jgi:hypothetical protein